MAKDNKRAIEIGKEAAKLSRRMEIHQSRNTFDMGGWKTKAAEAEYNRMQKFLDKLDAELDELIDDGKDYAGEDSESPADSSALDSFRQHMTKDFLAGNPSPEVQAVIDAGHIPDIPAEW